MKIETEIRQAKGILFECVCDHYRRANTILPLSKWLVDNMPHESLQKIKYNALFCLRGHDIRTEMIEELFAEELQNIIDAKFDDASILMLN